MSNEAARAVVVFGGLLPKFSGVEAEVGMRFDILGGKRFLSWLQAPTIGQSPLIYRLSLKMPHQGSLRHFSLLITRAAAAFLPSVASFTESLE